MTLSKVFTQGDPPGGTAKAILQLPSNPSLLVCTLQDQPPPAGPSTSDSMNVLEGSSSECVQECSVTMATLHTWVKTYYDKPCSIEVGL